ncbi:hypothetical protein O5O45_28955 [Hahella aquimaris]|nr:hypothetical protein [Hahella sp. HNIBRBA332]WLQ13763.1 hypothetical protein O5O45_28955 [Hahella sp. HNIBRBA332]
MPLIAEIGYDNRRDRPKNNHLAHIKRPETTRFNENKRQPRQQTRA